MSIIEQLKSHLKKRPIPFFQQLNNHGTAILTYLMIWFTLSLVIPLEIPSPLSVISDSDQFLTVEYFRSHVWVTLLRTLAGFSIAFLLGTLLGLVSFLIKKSDATNTLLMFFHIIPGLVLGIILLGIFGTGSMVPVTLIVFITTPLIAINCSHALIKRDKNIEDYIQVSGGKFRHRLLDSYLPALAPAIKSNYTIGFGLALKVVVLGEFIASMNGIGYRLNVAYIYLKLNEVFFHFTLILITMFVFQILFAIIYEQFLGKLNYSE